MVTPDFGMEPRSLIQGEGHGRESKDRQGWFGGRQHIVRPVDAYDMRRFEDARRNFAKFLSALLLHAHNLMVLFQTKFSGRAIGKKSNFASHLISTLTSLVIFTVCPSAMSTSSATGSSTKPPNVFPLTFKEHNFAAHCYNTIGCRVIYDNHNFSPYAGDQDPDTLVSPPPRSAQYKDDWGFASYIGVRNFPRPAEVRWKSKDGISHEAKIDISKIFKDELVLHKVPKSDYVEGSFDGSPSIFLEVNDRMISVYMEAYIPTKTEQLPENKSSTHRYDLILAWSHTY